MQVKLILPLLAFFAISCNNGNKEQKSTLNDPVEMEAANPVTSTPEQQDSAGFTSSNIPISDHDLGTFPFFSLPEDLKEQNKAINRKYDMLFFPIDSKMTRLEGKVWKSYIVTASSNYQDWSLPYFQKSYDDAITAVGGVKIFDGKVSGEELNRIKEEARYFGEEGSLDYYNEPVRVYVIRRQKGDDVYIQLAGNTSSGGIQILQKEAFKQTITLLKADQIQKDLADKGKAVLHINFDTDKATLKDDGKEAVAEIAKALSTDKNLRIAINGYTDNTGNEKHNLDLSKERAETVKAELAQTGIDAVRLSSDGFGQNNPIADNNTETGKAQNRRVELVKQ